jgi:hypothetical protein
MVRGWLVRKWRRNHNPVKWSTNQEEEDIKEEEDIVANSPDFLTCPASSNLA